MELRHLRYFVLVAEELHFGRAARRAGIAQPPLSQQIRSLEAELGVQLFERDRRSVELTDAGRALLPEARKTLQQAQVSISAARDGALGITGRLALGFVGSLAFGLLPAFLSRFRIGYPEIRVDLREMTSEQQLESLASGLLDLGLLRYAPRRPEIVCERISKEPLLAVIPAEHRLSHASSDLQTDELRGESFITFPRHQGPEFFDQIMKLCSNARFTPPIAQEATQMATIVSMVAAGLGVAIVPGSISALRLQGVTFRALVDARGKRPFAEVYLCKAARNESKVVEQAINSLRESAAEYELRLNSR